MISMISYQKIPVSIVNTLCSALLLLCVFRQKHTTIVFLKVFNGFQWFRSRQITDWIVKLSIPSIVFVCFVFIFVLFRSSSSQTGTRAPHNPQSTSDHHRTTQSYAEQHNATHNPTYLWIFGASKHHFRARIIEIRRFPIKGIVLNMAKPPQTTTDRGA